MNKLLIGLGVIEQPIEWMSRRFLLLFVVAVVVAWRSIPFTAIVCLAGLRAIPHEFYEAARIDGAGRWSSFRSVDQQESLEELLRAAEHNEKEDGCCIPKKMVMTMEVITAIAIGDMVWA